MGFEADMQPPAVEAAPPPAPAEGEQAAPKRNRPPLDEGARRKKAERAHVKKLLRKLDNAQDAEELWSRIEEIRDGKPAELLKTADKQEPAQPSAEALDPGQRTGWPPSAAVAEYAPLALDLWSRAEEALRGSRYSLSPRKAEVLDDQGNPREVEVRPVDTLARATAPVLAAHVHQAATTPEAALLLAVTVVFLPPALAHAKELAAAWWLSRQDAEEPKRAQA